MNEDFQEYGRYFQVGLRVEVGIPVTREEMFRDWAIVSAYDGDQVVADLSRDQLPHGVVVKTGNILDVGVWRGQEVYTCRAMVMEVTGGKTLRMRLLGAVVLKDRRQFYRLNVSLRARYSIPGRGTSPVRLIGQWEERRRRELESLRIRAGEYDEAIQKFLLPGEAPGEDEWHDRPSIRGVIGGGGIGFRLHRKLQAGDLIHLELHIPLFPFRIVHSIAEVSYVLDGVTVPEFPEPVYHTGLRFYKIDERDRDYIIEYISQVELERLREMSDRRQVREVDEERLEAEVLVARGRAMYINALFVVIFLLFVYLLTSFLLSYKARHENSIGRDFSNSFK